MNKYFAFVLPFAGLVLFAAGGCGHLDVSPGGNPDRVLTGTVNFQSAMPAGAEVVVRLIDTAAATNVLGPATNDLPVADRARPIAAERVLGDFRQTLSALTTEPVAFEIGYWADDAMLRRGLTVDVRILVDGTVRYRTLNTHVVRLASSPYRQEVWVQPVR